MELTPFNRLVELYTLKASKICIIAIAKFTDIERLVQISNTVELRLRSFIYLRLFYKMIFIHYSLYFIEPLIIAKWIICILIIAKTTQCPIYKRKNFDMKES